MKNRDYLLFAFLVCCLAVGLAGCDSREAAPPPDKLEEQQKMMNQGMEKAYRNGGGPRQNGAPAPR